MSSLTYDQYLDFRGSPELLADYDKDLVRQYRERYNATKAQSGDKYSKKSELESLITKDLDVVDKHSLGEVDVKISAKEAEASAARERAAKRQESATNFEKAKKEVELATDQDKLKAAINILNAPDKFPVGSAAHSRAIQTIEIANEMNRRAAEQVPSKGLSDMEYRYEHGVGKTEMRREGGTYGFHDNKERGRSHHTYIKKDPRPTKLENIGYAKHDITQKVVDKVARQVNLKAIISTEYFNRTHDADKDGFLSAAGKTNIFNKVHRLVKTQEHIYKSYLHGLSKILENPNMDINNPNQYIAVKLVSKEGGIRPYQVTHTAGVRVNWKPLSPVTKARKNSGEGTLSFWKNSGKLSKAYNNNLRQHLSKVREEDFYDYTKLERTMAEFRDTTSQPKALNYSDDGYGTKSYGSYGQRQTSVKFSVDLTVPVWRASNNGLMDDLITQPYNNPFSHEYTQHRGGGGVAPKISRWLNKNAKGQHKIRKKESDYYQEFLERLGESPLKRSEANPYIAQSWSEQRFKKTFDEDVTMAMKLDHAKKSKREEYEARARAYAAQMMEQQRQQEAEMDERNKPMKVKEFRNAFYNIKKLGKFQDANGNWSKGGTEVGVRRFINPEFRRPFIQKLSHAAGVQARDAIKMMAEK